MYLGDFARNAKLAAQTRARIRRNEFVFGRKNTVWSNEEVAVCFALWPNYRAIAFHLTGRSRSAVAAKCRSLGLAHTVHPWKASELSKLRRLYPEASWEEILAALPGRTREQIKNAVAYWKIRRKRKPYKPTGYHVLDQVRARCFECNMYMKDLDAIAHSKRYFYKAQWHSGWISHKAIANAVVGLDGRLIAQWDVSLEAPVAAPVVNHLYWH